MSHTTILHIFPNEKIEYGEELKNSWGSAAYVWDCLYETYVGKGLGTHYLQGLEKLWPLWKDVSVSEAFRAVLMMTFDHAYILRKDYRRAADDIDKFLSKYPSDPDRVNHWPTIAAYLRSATCPAIGFWHTSVSDCPFYGRWNEETEEYEIKWDEAYDLYAEIDSLKGEPA